MLHRTTQAWKERANGSGYASSGWTVIGESVPSYFYTNFRVRKNRMSFMKCKLPPVEGIEGGGTKLGWYRIYDCGTIKLKWIKQTKKGYQLR